MVILLFILLLGSLFTFVRGTLFNLAGERLVARVRRQLFESLMEQVGREGGRMGREGGRV